MELRRFRPPEVPYPVVIAARILTICTLLSAQTDDHATLRRSLRTHGHQEHRRPRAREHNLRGVNLELPRNKLIVFTGVSGSRQSRRSRSTPSTPKASGATSSRLSSYARQFLGQLPKPDVDYIGGLSPVDQHPAEDRRPQPALAPSAPSPRCRDFLRVLYARLGQGHCPKCERPITAQTREQIIGRILALPEGTRFLVLAPVVRGQKGEFKDFFADMLKRGFVRARVDGQVVKLTDDLKLDKRIKHTHRDRHRPLEGGRRRTASRVAEAVEQALDLAEGNLIISVESDEANPERQRRGDVDPSLTLRVRPPRRRHAALRPLRLHALQHQLRAADAAAVQLQQPARHVPRVRRPRHALHASTPTCSSPTRR